MPPLSIREDQLVPSAVWTYYETAREAVSKLQADTVSRIATDVASLSVTAYSGKTLAEIEDYFNTVLEEVDHHACMDLIAAAEAAIQVDCRKRIEARKKDPVSKSFRSLKKKTHNLRKIKFDSEILETWVSQRSGCKKAIGDFRGAWKYRNWLAHGRYWEYNTRYYPPAVLRIIQEMFAKMEITL